MATLILILLIILWLTGNLHVPGLTLPVFTNGGTSISFNDILIFLVILWLIGILPYPFRQIATVLLLLWLLSALGIIAVSGLSTIILIAIIFGLIAYLAG